jgi:hypothetical protein
MKTELLFLALSVTSCTSCVTNWGKPPLCQELVQAFTAGDEPVKFAQAFDGGLAIVKSVDGKTGQALVFIMPGHDRAKQVLTERGVKFSGTCTIPSGTEVSVGTDASAPIEKTPPQPKDVI